MAEQDEGVKQEVVKQSGRITKRALLKGLGAAGVLKVAGIGSAQAASETPTSTVTVTPDVDATKIAGLKTAIADQEKKNARKTEIADLEKKATALSQPPTNTPRPTEPPPTITPKSTETLIPTATVDSEATAKARATVDEASARYRGQLQATATAKAQPTTIPTPRPVTPIPGGSRSGGNEGGFPWGILAIPATLGAGAVGVWKSARFKGGVNIVLGAISRGKIKIP